MSTKKKAAAQAPTTAKTTASESENGSQNPGEQVTPEVSAKQPTKNSLPVYELADKDTGFYDHVTGFKVVRDQRVALSGDPGEATNIAIATGRLVLVS